MFVPTPGEFVLRKLATETSSVLSNRLESQWHEDERNSVEGVTAEDKEQRAVPTNKSFD